MQIGQNLIIENWKNSKFNDSNFFKLQASESIEYEYRTRFGHPSTYAFVKFFCEPSEELNFSSNDAWDSSLSSNYIKALEKAICEALVDVLISGTMYSYRGCSVILQKTKCDDVSSSEFSFYKATKIAFEQLLKDGNWKIVSSPLR